MRGLIFLSLAVVGVGVAGCGSDMGLVPVSGTVTLDGQPLPNAQVVFESNNGPVYGRTDSQGRYELEFSTSRRGAFPGENVVRIRTGVVMDDAPEEIAEEDEEDLAEEGLGPKERVPTKYNEDSELKVDVKRGGGPYDFELKSE